MHLFWVSLQIFDMALQLLIKMHRRVQNNSLLRTSRPTKHAWLTDDQYRRAQCGQTDTASDQHNDSQAAVTPARRCLEHCSEAKARLCEEIKGQ